PTACILCECNCGILVRLGGEDGRRLEQIRGDKAHPASKGYTCQKALRLDHYQNGRGERVLHPLRRRSDGSFEEIDWDTAIAEVAARLGAVRDRFGGESILYYGGGGQGNHLGGFYSTATLRAFGARYRSSAIAQEKTGEVWVNGLMFGTPVRGDFEHCEVAVFVGKNPWQSHSIPHARLTLRNIARDPARSLIVIDPRRTETAELAEFHLQVRPGRDAWLLAALAAVLVEEGLTDDPWLDRHAVGVADVTAALAAVPIAEYCRISGVDEALVRAAARRIARASSVAVFEDLGVQMNRHSTLVSYLEKLVWVLTGNMGQPGAQYAPATLVPIVRASKSELDPRTAPVSPVVGARILSGLIPCNVIPDEILTDHPRRYRALIVESGNPVHSLADSQRMREALTALEVVVAIDVFMTETARLADYVLPAATQFEKHEATFFNFEFPRNVFHLRQPLLSPPEGPLPEPEIHARLVEAAGVFSDRDLEPLRAAARRGRRQFAAAFAEATKANPRLGAVTPVVLYRTLGPTLPNGAAAAAALWSAAHRCAALSPASVRRAGFGEGFEAGENLFDAILTRPSGVVFAADDYEETWRRIQTDDGRVHLNIPELLEELAGLRGEQPPGDDPNWPFLLSAGERRSFTANTIMRDPSWRKSDAQGALRVSPGDATRLGIADGSRARLTTRRASVIVTVEVDDAMSAGHLALPNGLGVDHPEGAHRVRTGVAPNELTASEDRDPWVGTPWHKSVAARLEAVAASP
ncbi:MAG TPA: molybdopterin-dependent oxidoreductase, partial [Candidatus Methylomirabilis sp.]|nr:molybdopterin-dependent oxidoreductase [Candidatus Methylomirabilis sp.]